MQNTTNILRINFHVESRYKGLFLRIFLLEFLRKNAIKRLYIISRNHPLRAHESILSYVESRLSVLSMSFNKYIEVNLCCFIPGKVIISILHAAFAVFANNSIKKNNKRIGFRLSMSHYQFCK